jgi:hypothetical protein
MSPTPYVQQRDPKVTIRRYTANRALSIIEKGEGIGLDQQALVDDLRAALAAAQPAGRMFPIQAQRGAAPHPMQVPWHVAELAYSVYAGQNGTGQSLERLAQRGGFGPEEMDELLPDWRERCILAAQPKAPSPTSDCPVCGWQSDQEALDCEAAYEKATGRKLEPGDKEFLTFRAGWIAGHTRAALTAGPSESEEDSLLLAGVATAEIANRMTDAVDAIEREHHCNEDCWKCGGREGWHEKGCDFDDLREIECLLWTAAVPGFKRPEKPAAQPKAPSPTPGEVERDLESLRLYAHGYADTCRSDAKRDHIKRRADAYAANLRAALPAQGWTRESPTEPGFYWRSWCRHVSLEKVAKCTGDDGWYLGLVDEYGDEEPFEEGGWWMPASVPTPPNAEPGERSGE